MSRINQIQIRYMPAHDRLLMRLNTSDNAGFQFLLTRRFVRLLWPVLVNLLQKDEQISAQQTEQARKEVLSFQHEQVARSGDFQTRFREDIDQQPLGDRPVLLTRISVRQAKDGSRLLCLFPEDGNGIELKLDSTMLHSLCKLLKDTVTRAEWDIDLSAISSADTGATVPGSAAIN